MTMSAIINALGERVQDTEDSHFLVGHKIQALDNAQKYFDGSMPTANTDVRSFIAGEDPEMIESSLAGIGAHLKIAETALVEIGQLADMPIKEAQAYIAEATSRLGILNQEYTWYVNKYGTIKAEYDAAFSILAPQQAQQGAQEGK